MDTLHFRIMINATFGSRVRQARLARGMTQKDLGKHCGISRSAVSQWESGDTKGMDGAHLVAAANALHVSVDWLLDGKGEMQTINEDAGTYGPIPEPLALAWPLLTQMQQQALIEQAEALAEHNRSVLDELGKR